MPRTKRWNMSRSEDGVGTITLSSWKYFMDFIYQKMLDYPSYIWRGQRCDNWRLSPTLDRVMTEIGVAPDVQPQFRRAHLDCFKYAARGRRASSATPIASDNEWWALGQHHGLATPLLDWVTSPFVAAYFAFFEEGPSQTPRRMVFALHHFGLERRARELQQKLQSEENEKHAKSDQNSLSYAVGPLTVPMPVEIVRPLSDENPRLVSQGGLFTRGPDGLDLESWVRKNFPGHKSYILMKISIPDRDRVGCLRSLNRMNINHLSLFPDLYGASVFCNLSAEIKKY